MRQVQPSPTFYHWPQPGPVATPNNHPPIKKTHFAAEYIRKNWDETLLYHQQIAVLLLNDHLQPIGLQMIPIHIGEFLNMRGAVRTAVNSNAAYVYISINSLDEGPVLTATSTEASLLETIGRAFDMVEISIMGYFILNAWTEQFYDPLSGLDSLLK